MGEIMREIRIVDTTLRDGHLSLWATRLDTRTMAEAAPHIDRAGYAAVEITGAGTFKKVVRELHEDPWERIRQVRARMPHTRLRAIQTRSPGAFQRTPRIIRKLYLERLAANGVDELRLSDPSNTEQSWADNVEMAREAGLDVILNLIYTLSPKHDDEYYWRKAAAAAALPVRGICLKDPGGLITPDRLRTLLPGILSALGELELEFHGHCSTGLGPVNALVAAELGASIIDTALPPLANGVSLPSVFNVVDNLRARGDAVRLDLTALAPAVEALERTRARLGLARGAPLEFDAAYLEHQVPGGMMSNLRSQLAAVGMADRMPDVLAEIAQVRRDLGYPIMVTPYSQFVGMQAALNVISGERYRQVPDELIQYALGLWGREEAEAIEPTVRRLVVERDRARQLAGEPSEPTLADVRRSLDAEAASDEELVLMSLAGDLVPAGVPAGQQSPWYERNGRWLELVEALADRPRWRAVSVRKGDARLRLSRSGRMSEEEVVLGVHAD